jgi:hypothetical protein
MTMDSIERGRLEAAIKGISLPPGPNFAWVDGHRPFIEAALAVIARVDEAVTAPHPGEQHKFETTCITCGEYGQLFIAILGPDEQARIEPIEKVDGK